MSNDDNAAPGVMEKAKSFLFYFFQVFMIWLLVDRFELEKSTGVTELMPIWCIAALLNFWTSRSWKLPLLIITTAITIFCALGMISGIIFYVISGAFIFTAHLNIQRSIRSILLLLGLAALVLIRMQYVYMPRVYAAIPLVGMFFMFRFLLYWYELKYETKPSSWSMRLSYLYNPLNAAFPLFPVFDFKVWQRTYYDATDSETYTLGFRRMFFGIALMFLYRITYAYNPNPANIQTANELLVYLFLAYFFIVRILGIYWFALGLLGLFGFRLPRVFEQVFFITRFSMIWRQVNIYWKDFIQKLIYFPIYFKLRKKIKSAVLVSGLITFLCTWFFHNWQFFWIKGHFPLRLTDFLYWLILGMIISTSLYIQSRKPVSAAPQEGIKNTVLQTLRASGIFLVMCIMWSFWSSETIGEWLHLHSHLSNATSSLLPTVGVFLLLLSGAAVLYHHRHFFEQLLNRVTQLHHTLFLSLLFVPLIWFSYPASGLAEQKIVQLIMHQAFNQSDQENAEQGYYEQMGNAGSEHPWQVNINAGNNGKWFSDAEQPVDDIRMRILKSDFSVASEGRSFTTNSFGMRNPEISYSKPPNTIRIAILGASYEMGGGVSDEEVFARLVEAQLNDSLRADHDSIHIEVLNFAVGAYHLPQYVWICEHDLFNFHPDVVLSFAHSSEKRRLNGVVARMIQNGVELSTYPTLQHVREASGAQQTMSRIEIRNRLYPYNDSLLNWGYQSVAAACIAHQAVPVWVYLPSLADAVVPAEQSELSAKAVACGFRTISLANVFPADRIAALQISPDDSHPNAAGHQLIANRLSAEILSQSWFRELLQGKSTTAP